MNGTVIRGPHAELCWAYYQAAVLGPWTITMHPSGCELTATVLTHDAFRTSQPSLTFRVARPHAAAWVWPVESLQIADGTLTARLTQKD